MNFYDKNLKVLKEVRHFLYERLESEINIEQSEPKCKIESIETRDGNKAILVEKDGTSYRLNSAYKPLVEAEKWADQFNYNNLDPVITMFGFGNGVFVRELLKRTGETDIILILEPSIDIFLHTLNNYDISDILAEVRVSISIDNINKIEFKTLVERCINWVNLSSHFSCVHPQYDKLFNEEYRGYLKIIKDVEVSAIVNKNTEAYWGTIMARNEINNIKYLKKSNVLDDFYGLIPDDIPAIIVAAGPSLDKNIRQLKEAKGKAIIFAVDTALKYLLALDIEPDFVVTIDATKYPGHFDYEKAKEIPLWCKSISNPEILELHKGRKIFFAHDKFIDGIYRRLNKRQTFFNVGGNVSTAAFAICVTLGFKRIVLVGQDLCFKGDYTHAGAVVSNPHGSDQGAFTMVEDIYGNMVKARYDWYTSLLWFEDAISVSLGVEVINATEGGAKMKGAKIMTLREVIDQYCNKEFDVSHLIDNIKPSFSEDELPLVKKYLEDSIVDLEHIASRSKECIDICTTLIREAQKDRIWTKDNQKLVKRIEKLNKDIEEKRIYQLLNDYISKVSTEQLGKVNQMTEDTISNQVKTYTISREIYKAVYEAADILHPLLVKSVEDFEMQ